LVVGVLERGWLLLRVKVQGQVEGLWGFLSV
jgi:hypothetical protein